MGSGRRRLVDDGAGSTLAGRRAAASTCAPPDELQLSGTCCAPGRHWPGTTRIFLGAAIQIAAADAAQQPMAKRKARVYLPVASWTTPAAHGPAAPPPIMATVTAPKMAP